MTAAPIQPKTWRWWLKLAVEGAIVVLCLWFATKARGQDKVDIAVLKNRADSIDAHLHATDDSLQRLWTQTNTLQNDISELEGEERIASIVIGLLSSGSLALQFRRKGERG